LRLPQGFNKCVSKIMKQFRREVEERIARREAMKTLKAQQRYVLNKLQRYYEEIEDTEIKSDIERLKEAFSLSLPNVVLQHLGKLRREGIEGKALFERLIEIYFQYGLHRLEGREEKDSPSYEAPKIICSMAMVSM